MRVQLSRLLAVTLGTTALVAAALPSAGLSVSGGKSARADCGRVEFVNGPEVVFGREKTQKAATALQARVIGRGFANANIIPGCAGFRVVVRGIDTFDVAVELQAEARKEEFPATIECIKAKGFGVLQAIFGHRRDRAGAQELVAAAARSGMPGLKLQPDPCGGFQVFLSGFKNRAEAEDFRDNARRAGFNVVLKVDN